MKRRIIKAFLGTIALSTLIFVVRHAPLQSPTRLIAAAGSYQIDHFIDGDTIAVNMDGHIESIRLLGVDTPETVKPNVPTQCFGPEASDFMRRAIGGQPVRLVADPGGDNRDQYNRLIRYVYLPDGQLLNEELVSEGYGFAYVTFPFSKHDEFAQAQDSARAAERGLWGACQPIMKGGRWQTNDL